MIKCRPRVRIPLRLVLATLPEPLGEPAQRAVAVVLAGERPPPGDLAQELQAVGLTERQAHSVARTVRLSELAGHHAPLVRGLQALVAEDPDVTLAVPGPPDFRHAARLGIPARRAGELPTSDAAAAPFGSEAAFARSVQARIQAAHPTAALVSRLTDDGRPLGIPDRDVVTTFLQAYPQFDITSTPIEPFLHDHAGPGDPDHRALVTGLTTLRRVDRLTTTWDDAAALLDSGLQSALDIAGKSADGLTQLLTGTVEPAEVSAIYERAVATRDAGLAVLTSLARVSPDDVPVIPSGTPTPNFLPSIRPCDPCSARLTPAPAATADRFSVPLPTSSTSWSTCAKRLGPRSTNCCGADPTLLTWISPARTGTSSSPRSTSPSRCWRTPRPFLSQSSYPREWTRWQR